MICRCLALLTSIASADDVLLTSGPIEVLVTPTGIEHVLLRDRHVIGDPRPDRGTAVRALIHGEGFSTLAAPTDEGSDPPKVTSDANGRAGIALAGVMAHEAGGKWRWTMEIGFDGRTLDVEYSMTEVEPPAEPILSNRLQIALPQEQILGLDRRPEHVNEPGVEMLVRSRDGQEWREPFGADPTHFANPAEFMLPFDESHAPLSIDGDAERLEFWQGGWLQVASLHLARPEPEVSTRIRLDLGPLGAKRGEVRAEPIPAPEEPWLAKALQPRAKPERIARFVQNLDFWKNKPLEEKQRNCAELAKHFDVAEGFFAYLDWRYADPAGNRVDTFTRQIQEWTDVAHDAGLKVALSLSWSTPLSHPRDSSMPEEFWGQVFDPLTGEFAKVEQGFDWGDPAAREAAFAALKDVADRLHGVDYLFFNEPHFNVSTWYETPFYSEAALTDFREFAGDGSIRFPAKPYAVETSRTDNAATQGHWRLWHDWINQLYTQRIAGEARVFAEANQDNPDYGGAIWFQASSWFGDDFAVDLDQICAIPEVTYIVCEYATTRDHPGYRAFRYYADRHQKRFGTFVNVGRYDATQPGSTRYQGSVQDTRRAIRLGIEENADMVAAYPMWSFFPWNEAHSPERVQAWDEELPPLTP